MKSYTDIEQSKKLAEILPIETADMKWYFWKSEIDAPKLPTFGYSKDAAESYKSTEAVYLPCWSLAALLEEIPDITVNDVGENLELHIKKNYLSYENESTGNMFEIETELYENMIDACVEMISKLKENNLL